MSNIGRNKKRTVLVVISLSLSIVLLNTVVTLSDSIDMDKFLSKFTDTDFLIAHADYFNDDFHGVENETSEQMISAVKSLDGFEGGGKLYGGRDNLILVTDPNSTQEYNKNDAGDFFGAMYGLESLPMQRLQLLDGEIDMKKLLTGDYILEGVNLDDNSRAMWDTAHFDVGETVTLHNYTGDAGSNESRTYTSHSYTVLGHVAVKTYVNCDRSSWDYTFYLPAEVYKSVVDTPAVMSYAFNVEDEKEEDTDAFLKMYTNDVEPMMNYNSKATTTASFAGMQDTVLLVGGALSGIIGLIGILNFINAVLTSIVARKKEFAMMQCIGMTRKQLRTMLCCEGLCYAGLSGALSLVLGIFISLVVVKIICAQMWFLSYQLIIWPLLAAVPLLLFLGVSVPLAVYGTSVRKSIVERLREAE